VDGPFEFGTPKEQGKRNDLLEVKAKLDTGVPMVTIADEHFGSYIRYHRAFEEYRCLKVKPRSKLTELILVLGPTSCGKSTGEPVGLLEDVHRQDNGQWWNDYHQQKDVVIDEYLGWIPAAFLNRLVDKTPLLVPYKGGFHVFNSERIWILSNYLPETWYDPKRTYWAAFERRITRIHYKYAPYKEMVFNAPGAYFNFMMFYAANPPTLESRVWNEPVIRSRPDANDGCSRMDI